MNWTKKVILYICALLTVLILPGVLAGCGDSGVMLPAMVDEKFFSEISVIPEKYNGETVTFTGYWFEGFEIACIAERLEPQEGWPGNYQPAGILIWAKGAFPNAEQGKLTEQPDNPTGYPAFYGKVQVTGVFEYGGKYGHMDAYKYQLTLTDATVLEWVPAVK